MKKLIMTLAVCLAAAVGVNAQDVYDEIMRLSKEVRDDKSKDLQTRRVASFKVDGLTYMMQATRDMMPDSLLTTVLNNQAYALYDFVNTYVTLYKNSGKKKEMEKIKQIFTDASLNNPRFNDKDKELTHAYIDADGFNTPFSLDTDWVLALDEVKKKLRTMM